MLLYQKCTLIIFTLYAFVQTVQSQCLLENMITIEGNVPVMTSYTLNKPNGISGSELGYCSEYFNKDFGGSYLLLYKDEGGSGMDAYPSIRIGGSQFNNQWNPGDKEITGMPVKIKNIDPGMHFELITSQEKCFDDDDKWMASVNFIFDSKGTEESKPITAERDYDLVVKAQSYNFSDSFNDQLTPVNNRFWFYARNMDGSLKPYSVQIEGITYTYAVRYKFFKGTEDKDNKAHVKFIPFGPNGTAPIMKINVSEIIRVSKEYIDYAAIPEEQLLLAHSKIANDDTYLKGINAGYEVYKGESTLRIDKYKLYPTLEINGTINEGNSHNSSLVYPNPFRDHLFWDCLDILDVELMDMHGNKYSLNSERNSVNLSYLHPGIYIIKFRYNSGESKTKKIIKN